MLIDYCILIELKFFFHDVLTADFPFYIVDLAPPINGTCIAILELNDSFIVEKYTISIVRKRNIKEQNERLFQA